GPAQSRNVPLPPGGSRHRKSPPRISNRASYGRLEISTSASPRNSPELAVVEREDRESDLPDRTRSFPLPAARWPAPISAPSAVNPSFPPAKVANRNRL